MTGVLLVGGASRRFGAAKALAEIGGETFAERAWRLLGQACDERLAVGKAADRLPLPFPVLDDGIVVRAPIAGVVAGLRAATTEVAVFLPVDCPLMTVAALRSLGEAVAVSQAGPLPGAYAKQAHLPELERRLAAGELRLWGVNETVVHLDDRLLTDVDTPADFDAVTGSRTARSP